jgi:hypothetical protein
MLGVIPILTSFNQLNSTMNNVPKFSYNSWLVEFMFIHAVFNVLSMFEFAVISFVDFRVLLRQEKEAAMRKKTAGAFLGL